MSPNEAMKMIALDTQGVVGFNAFFQAAAAAYAAALRSGTTISERRAMNVRWSHRDARRAVHESLSPAGSISRVE